MAYQFGLMHVMTGRPAAPGPVLNPAPHAPFRSGRCGAGEFATRFVCIPSCEFESQVDTVTGRVQLLRVVDASLRAVLTDTERLERLTRSRTAGMGS